MGEEQFLPVIPTEKVHAALFQLSAHLEDIALIQKVADLVNRDLGRGVQRHRREYIVGVVQVVLFKFIHTAYIQPVDIDLKFIAEPKGQKPAAGFACHADQQDVFLFDVFLEGFQRHFQNDSKVAGLIFRNFALIKLLQLHHRPLGYGKSKGIVLLDFIQNGVCIGMPYIMRI